jgi:hypothetical protein
MIVTVQDDDGLIDTVTRFHSSLFVNSLHVEVL